MDFIVANLDTATKEIELLGGSWIDRGQTPELEGFRWRCMADQEGNEFAIDLLP